MKIVGYTRSQLAKDIIVVSIKCEKCGVEGHVTCKALSQLRTYICSSCGHVNYDKDGAQVNKGAKGLVKGKLSDKSEPLHRTGVSRMLKVFNSMKRKNKVDLSVFKDKEAFICWSVDNGYRDWKVLKLNKATGMVDRGARWVTSTYGVNSDIGKIKDSREAVETGARYLGGAIDDAISGITEALDRYEVLKQRFGELRNEPNLSGVDNSLRRVIRELDRINGTLNNVV